MQFNPSFYGIQNKINIIQACACDKIILKVVSDKDPIQAPVYLREKGWVAIGEKQHKKIHFVGKALVLGMGG